MPPAFHIVGQGNAARFGSGFAQELCRPRRRIDFHAVVHFEHFDIPLRCGKPARRLAHEMGQQRDAQREIPGLEHRHSLRRFGQQHEMRLAETGRADKDRDARRACRRQIDAERIGRRKIDEAIALHRQRFGIAARINTHLHGVPRLGDGRGQRLAHPALVSDHSETHRCPAHCLICKGGV